jgi:prepilin-type N-terminal cleavage/methylation domain-containing protein
MTPRPRAIDRSRAGYSLLEMLIVLAIMAAAVAIVAPRGEAMLDQMTTHAVFFDFQRQILDLRREAYAKQTRALVMDSTSPVPAPAADGEVARVLSLRTAWTYRLERPIRISEGGGCTKTAAQILNRGRVVMNLTTSDGSCHFIRQD